MYGIPIKYLVACGAVIAFLIALWAWGNSRYHAGVRDADARWVEAGERLEKQARAAGDAADRASARRIEQNNDLLAEEKEKLDEAEAAGTSPLDVLFGS